MNISYTIIIPDYGINTTGQDLDSLIEKESKKEEQFDFAKTYYEVCKIYKQDPDKVLKYNKSRKREYVLIRQVTMTMAKLKSNLTLTVIGAPFGKDHATVIHAVKTVKNLSETDRQFKKEVGHLFKNVEWPQHVN